ncbi:NAD-dependent epimerase/dehydratase family protein [Halomarina salina]|uniref:NAD-dependent epimerase/dehydratase family protein n=1 Tax=Halomarina salina TaxID=1872699 RepID=A0ABD5RSP4_9EURY|nr:NAD(P)-dependent oxidoreductase [Halomarina salina]
MSDHSDVVAVTGGLGGVGRWVVDRLATDGSDVVCIDRYTPDERVENVDFYEADLTDAGETLELLDSADPDAVVHLAAIPDPTSHAGSRVFSNNTLSTYNVLTAAGRVGARVSWASSESAYGFPFSEDLLLPDYLPIDESHPMRPEDPYGTSKVAGEEVAEMVVRRYGVQVASIRPSWVQYPGAYQTTANREAVDIGAIEPGTRPPGVGNFWSYVDVRDLADQFVRSIRTDLDGHEPYLAHAPDNYAGVDTERLFEAVTGGDLPDPFDVEGEECAFTTAKAREDLGWEAEHTWRDARNESVDGPSFG